MISWSKLLTGQIEDGDNLRYSSVANHIPRIVVWNSTSTCNLKCRHCYFDADLEIESPELTKLEAENFITDLSQLKVPVLIFSGGEPLLKKNIFELGKFAKDKGIRAVLSTNGTLISEEVAKKIKQAGFSYVGISLDGTKKTNDRFRQTSGAFGAAVSGIKNCQSQGLKVGLRLTLTKYNFSDLPQIFDLVEKESIPRMCIYHLVYSGRASDLKTKDLSHKQRRQVLELIWTKTREFSQKKLKVEILTVDNHADGVWIYLKLKSKDPVRAKKVLGLLKRQGGNSSGSKVASVDNQGNVYPDQFWRSHRLGNIRTRNFSDIWQDKKNTFLADLRNRKALLKGRCKICNFQAICNGNFRARAESSFADIWAPDPACYLSQGEIYAGN
jgi:radical SAM protein with 4Fe4S-binding SPASM domain